MDVFALGAIPNKPETEAASVKGPLVALNGELRGEETHYYFAYNDNGSCEGGGQSPESEATGTVKASTTVSEGLESDTQYTFCVVATNAYGQELGPPLTFTTELVPPSSKQ